MLDEDKITEIFFMFDEFCKEIKHNSRYILPISSGFRKNIVISPVVYLIVKLLSF
ncbi:hypothetical protein EZS27_033271 [termite gut metagenome]|uniref:Uncharacterized protein n=1 Tax=termite gut metagenome TaxID=433724 RepID=A0A5J4Q449_9ZZZZ